MPSAPPICSPILTRSKRAALNGNQQRAKGCGHWSLVGGRVVDHRWYAYAASADRDRYTYGYDRASNRLYRENALTTARDELYGYDQVNRLVEFARGELNANKDGITGTPAREEDWSLDMTGNWPGYVQKTSGSTDLDQARTHNPVNEITAITAATGTNWADPVHDRNGNMTTIPKPANLADGLTATYDAWNRLVEVKDGQTIIARYDYDGLNRRIKSHIDSGAPSNPSGIDTHVHYYHNSAWQILETRQSDTPSAQPETLQPKHQYVWSQRYIDAPVLRDENTGTKGLCDDERLYYLNDANFNVTALLDTTGDPVERYVYSPYGVVTIYDATWTNTRSASSYANLTLYTGRELDSETGLYYYRNRYYGAELGRFVSRDAIGYAGSKGNLYEYASSRSIGWTDAMGMSPSDVGKPCFMEGEKRKSQVHGPAFHWAGSRWPPSTTSRGIRGLNEIGAGLNWYDTLPDVMKPPIGVSPGLGDASEAFAGHLGGLLDGLGARDGVRIWVRINCNECVCRYRWWPRSRWEWTWKEMAPVWYQCDAKRPIGHSWGFSLNNPAAISKAVPGCIREAWEKADCDKSTFDKETWDKARLR